MPSRWYETFGRAIVEAYSRGKPVIAARLGAMSELVQDGATGFLFDPTSPTDLAAAAMKFMQLDENKKQSMRLAARAEYDQRLSPEASYQSLLKIYEYALRNKV
ncbi:MAG: glycosyltransferase [Pirellulaceae bacterium]